VVILLSDGHSTPATAIAAATTLKAGGATVFSFGFGRVNKGLLTNIASSASQVHTPHMHVHAVLTRTLTLQ
jgi:hypothetical protein